ncbi:MAG TPA: class I SAM-dependent methyltransferase [Dehalococcoidia bacterium]|nr:class I SAM-dependent methyltransferase [Dehalococcoidia bacterium]
MTRSTGSGQADDDPSTGSGETERVRAAYARRAELGLDARYDYWTPANLYIYQQRERALLDLLRRNRLLPLTGRSVLDAGCGDGAVLRDLLRYGAAEAGLHGIDLLPDRVDSARERLPRARIDVGDAQRLDYPDASVDLVLAFTLLSSLLDAAARRRVCDEMARVTKPGGLVLVYDFWTNPMNRDARPLRRAELRGLFPGKRIEFRAATLAPPIVRALVRLPGGRLACSALEVIPFVQTHYLAAIHV